MSSDRSTPSQQMRRMIFIDLLRAVACLWVLDCHFHGIWLNNIRVYGWNLKTLLVRIAGFGGKGVDLFIVISGFCLFFPVLQRATKGDPFKVSVFYIRRIKRIFPVYYSALAISVVLVTVPALRSLIASYRGPKDVVPYLLLMQNYMPDFIGRINGPLWSVALECQLYVVMPLWVWLFRKSGVSLPLVISAIVSLLAGLLQPHGLTWHGFSPFVGHGLPARVFEFVAGMVAAVCVTRPRSWHLPAAIAVILCAVPLAVTSQTRYAGPWLESAGVLFWGSAFASLVILASRLEQTGVLNHRCLAPLAWVGLISYSVYVIHFPVMLMLKPLVNPLLHGIISSFCWAGAIGVPIILANGFLLYLLVERYSVPATRRHPIVRQTGRSSPSVPTAALAEVAEGVQA